MSPNTLDLKEDPAIGAFCEKEVEHQMKSNILDIITISSGSSPSSDPLPLRVGVGCSRSRNGRRRMAPTPHF